MRVRFLQRVAAAFLNAALLLTCALSGAHAEVQGSANAINFRNANLLHRADPWVYKHTDGYYYYMSTVPEFDRLELRKSRTLSGIGSAAPVVIWTKHASGIMGANIWAPEIHFINNKWYVYFTAGESSNAFNVRLYALENSAADPTTGTWVEDGRITTAWDSFTLDATTFVHNNVQYLVWAQKPAGSNNINSNVYIAKMTDPLHMDVSTQTLVTTPNLTWEQQGYLVNEGPEVIKRNGQIFISYSASSCDPRYVMGLVTASDTSNLLSSASWSKSSTPVFQSNPSANVYGPGHNAFVQSADGTEDYLMYHAYSDGTVNTCFGNQRSMRIQKFTWDAATGKPVLGVPVSTGTVMPTPAGDNRFEAEYAVRGGLATVMTYANASNGKDVGFINDASSFVRFDNVQVPVAGAYALSIRFANGSGTTASHKMTVNGGVATVVSYPPMAAWGTFSTVTVNAQLNAGSNAITLTYNSNFAEIDYLQVDPISYEAEAASVVNAQVVSDVGATGGKKVGYIDTSNSYVQFAINVPTAGIYTLAARHDNGSKAAASHLVSVNGGANVTLNYPYYAGDGWVSYRSTSVNVTLNAGANTVRIAKGAGATELDRIELLPALQSGGRYRLTNRSSGKVLDDANAGTADGNNVQQWEDLSNTAQRWTITDLGNGYYQLINVVSGKALNVASGSTVDGANVDISTSTGANNQQWNIVNVGPSTYKLIARHSGKALDLIGASPANGANIRQWPDNGLDAQKWVLELAP